MDEYATIARVTKSRQRVEETEQAKFVEWAVSRGLWLWHTPNELVGKVSRAEASRQKRLGVLAGVVDILIGNRVPVRPDARGVALEFKTDSGAVTKEQLLWMGRAADEGWICAVVRSADEAKAFCLEMWPELRP